MARARSWFPGGRQVLVTAENLVFVRSSSWEEFELRTLREFNVHEPKYQPSDYLRIGYLVIITMVGIMDLIPPWLHFTLAAIGIYWVVRTIQRMIPYLTVADENRTGKFAVPDFRKRSLRRVSDQLFQGHRKLVDLRRPGSGPSFRPYR